MTAPLSPEALKLQEALNSVFTKLGEAFREVAKPRYTMDEIGTALKIVIESEPYGEVAGNGMDEFTSRVETELEKARKP